MDAGIEWLTEHEEAVWRRFIRITSLLPLALNRQLSEDSDLSLSDFEVLVHLTDVADGELRVAALAELMAWERSRLSHHLTRMESRFLVKRRPCPNDGRGMIVTVTDAGREAIAKAAPGHLAAVRDCFFAPLTPGSLESLDAITAALLAQLTQRLYGRCTAGQI